MDERILEHLKLLNQYLLYLRNLSGAEEESFARDFKFRGSAERFLQLSIESCINVGNRILSVVQFQRPVQTPESYGDIFTELGKLGVLPQEFVPTMLQMVKFRNRLVHIYWEVDHRQLYTILRERLGDMERFREYILDFLREKQNEGFRP